ncbi:MAG: NAD(P)-dependent glycerol-3-phosphate dehydrogenase [Clostridiales Family XIII bacterium]|jgi:glycerol-3-phosphate dehydrogenase (NAD(P)+)|nr:NAD(P)-dependent glycerol-3-phosphate dehydrogenase [Clostridiales Family XIII bacterium]
MASSLNLSTVRIGIIGAGSWGTALANRLAANGLDPAIWDLDTELLAALKRDRENRKYLPGVPLDAGVRIADTPAEVVDGADVALFAVPAQHFRTAFLSAQPAMKPDALILNVAKGIELGSLKTISQIAAECAPGHTFVVLSGPSHAEEVGLNRPTTVAVASADTEAEEFVQALFMSDVFRVYTNSDVLGLELGGALKNIIALGAGIADGMGFGDNTKAALMTRGLAEMTRLGVALGAKRETFSGLAGVGDLIVTCTSMHSRNRRCGILIGEGMPPEEAKEKIGMVVEGITTAEAAYALAQKHGVEVPITEAICKVVRGELGPREALTNLMRRPRRHEAE